LHCTCTPRHLPCCHPLLLAACPAWLQLASALGWAWLVKTYVVPYLIVNFWLVTITMLQHTHPGGWALRTVVWRVVF
jgi:fatty acid desaturase